MSTVKTDNVVGSFTPLPVIASANAAEIYSAGAGQTTFTTTKFDQTSAIKVFAKVGSNFVELAATWSGANAVTISGITLTTGQKVYIYSVGDAQLRNELVDPLKGANGLAFKRTSPAAATNIGSMLSTLTITPWEGEFVSLITSKPNANDPATWDWAPAIQAAVNTGRSVQFPAGTFCLGAPIVAAFAGQRLLGAGVSQTTIKALAGFVGSALLIMGNKVSVSNTSAMQARDFTVDCASVTGVGGIEAYGLRDGSMFSSVYVTNNKNAPGIKTAMSGNGTGVAASKMCEGVQILNCHVITSQDMVNASYWQLDGLFESQLIGCKALGSSLATVSGSTGFKIGTIAEVRGTALIGCSAGNLPGAGSNVGIRYGEWARECWDEFSTFENIIGNGVYFHGSAVSGTLCPFNCRSLSPRPYNNTTAGGLDPLYRYGDANACYAGPVVYYSSAKVWARFDAPVASQFNNVVEILAGSVPSALLTTIISFDAACATSNIVTGFSSDAAASRKRININKGGHTERYEGNGFSEQNDGSWTSFNLGTPDKLRFRSNGLSSMLEMDGAAGTITPQVRFIAGQAYNAGGIMSLGTYRMWIDTFGRIRNKNGTPSTAIDGNPVSQKVAVPASATSAGAPGDWAASSGFYYAYVGDGTTHSWVRSALASW